MSITIPHNYRQLLTDTECSQVNDKFKDDDESEVDGLIKIFAHKEDKEFYSFVNVNLYGQMNNFMHMQ